MPAQWGKVCDIVCVCEAVEWTRQFQMQRKLKWAKFVRPKKEFTLRHSGARAGKLQTRQLNENPFLAPTFFLHFSLQRKPLCGVAQYVLDCLSVLILLPVARLDNGQGKKLGQGGTGRA